MSDKIKGILITFAHGATLNTAGQQIMFGGFAIVVGG